MQSEFDLSLSPSENSRATHASNAPFARSLNEKRETKASTKCEVSVAFQSQAFALDSQSQSDVVSLKKRKAPNATAEPVVQHFVRKSSASPKVTSPTNAAESDEPKHADSPLPNTIQPFNAR